MTLKYQRFFIPFLIVLLFLSLRPFDELDTLWHIAMGKLIIASWTPAPVDLVMYLEKPASVSWLAELIFASVFNLFSLEGVRLFGSIAFALSFALLFASESFPKSSLLSKALALILTLATVGSNTSVRPQNIALVCFSLLYLQFASKNRSYLLPIIIGIFWQNIHPSLLVGALLALCFAIATRERYFFWVYLLLCVVQFITPDGVNIIEISKKNLQIAAGDLGITEWQHPWNRGVFHAMYGFWIAFGFSLILIFKIRKRIHVADGTMFLVFTALSFYSARFSLYWAFTMIPVWSRWIDESGLFLGVSSSLQKFFREKYALPALLFLTLCTTCAWIYLPKVKEDIPIKEISKISSKDISLNVYHLREWSGLVALYGSLDWKKLFGGRVWEYPNAHWNDYLKESNGEISLDDIIARYNPSVFILEPNKQSGLIQKIDQRSDWSRIVATKNVSIYERKVLR